MPAKGYDNDSFILVPQGLSVQVQRFPFALIEYDNLLYHTGKIRSHPFQDKHPFGAASDCQPMTPCFPWHGFFLIQTTECCILSQN